mmetsp:Transcript_14813/g.30147  ORF Transcript_14813/g.30147 Transcript_14813/m.30147 type:complete len:227 (-) Transcript_14813:977-1657(-)
MKLGSDAQRTIHHLSNLSSELLDTANIIPRHGHTDAKSALPIPQVFVDRDNTIARALYEKTRMNKIRIQRRRKRRRENTKKNKNKALSVLEGVDKNRSTGTIILQLRKIGGSRYSTAVGFSPSVCKYCPLPELRRDEDCYLAPYEAKIPFVPHEKAKGFETSPGPTRNFLFAGVTTLVPSKTYRSFHRNHPPPYSQGKRHQLSKAQRKKHANDSHLMLPTSREQTT